MTTDSSAAWDHYAATYQREAALPTDVARYGPDLPTEADLRLLGDLRGKRVLDLGCGGGQACIAFVRAGATAVGVDSSSAQLAHARRLAEAAEVRVELRQGDLADLAFMRADSIDAAFSAGAFAYVEDLARVFRQVHRVLKVGAPLVFSLPHPTWAMVGTDLAGGARLARSYFDRTPIVTDRDGASIVEYPHRLGDLYGALARASYRVDTILEPEPVAGMPRSSSWVAAAAEVPRTLVVRARKEGS